MRRDVPPLTCGMSARGMPSVLCLVECAILLPPHSLLIQPCLFSKSSGTCWSSALAACSGVPRALALTRSCWSGGQSPWVALDLDGLGPDFR